jgi:hypothetical protein
MSKIASEDALTGQFFIHDNEATIATGVIVARVRDGVYLVDFEGARRLVPVETMVQQQWAFYTDVQQWTTDATSRRKVAAILKKGGAA